MIVNSVFKIRRKSDGMFSSGGTPPKFTKTGKAWANHRTFNQHISQFSQSELADYYENCEILVFDLSHRLNYVSKLVNTYR